VTEQGVSLHLAETDSSVSLSTLHGLSSDRHNCPGGSGLRFITNHMSQSLVKYDSNEDVRLNEEVQYYTSTTH
jgi:hypothetical protein